MTNRPEYYAEQQYLLNKIVDLEDLIIKLADRLDYISSIINKKDDINGIDIGILEQYIREKKIKRLNEK